MMTRCCGKAAQRCFLSLPHFLWGGWLVQSGMMGNSSDREDW
jgi:hypothetical protein